MLEIMGEIDYNFKELPNSKLPANPKSQIPKDAAFVGISGLGFFIACEVEHE